MSPEFVTHLPLELHPDPSRTVLRPFLPSDPDGFGDPGMSRPERIAERVLDLSDAEADEALDAVIQAIEQRHRGGVALLDARADELEHTLRFPSMSQSRARLVASYLMQEYAFESAALFNPSVVIAPEIAGPLAKGDVPIAIALRGVGEGHVSSVTFRTGTWHPGAGLHIDPIGTIAVPPRLVQGSDEEVTLVCEDSQMLSEVVLFPAAERHRAGIEDVRMVRFTEADGETNYYATYTAFDGRDIRSELITVKDMRSFSMRPLRGDASRNKGMALFPRHIDGSYAMIGRKDNENIWFLRSDDLFEWNGGTKIVRPRFSWELVQLGNCGSPLEVDEGWLLLTHGVGPGRSYAVGACLLDRDDPSKLLARTPEPILEPVLEERGGYVPNVVYSCGGVIAGGELLLPYAVADTFTRFATMRVTDLLAFMR